MVIEVQLGCSRCVVVKGAVTNGPEGSTRRSEYQEVNIKKLPLISHKAAVNRTDALKVLAAWGRRQTLFLLGATGPLRCVTLGATFNGRRRRSPSTPNVRQSHRHGRGILCPSA